MLLRLYEIETDDPFPQDPARQLSEVLRSMARAWEGTSARLLRQAKGAPVEAALGLVVQEMAQGIGQGISGSGVIQFVDPVTGAPQVTGRYLGQSQGRDALKTQEALYLTKDPRGPSLEDAAPGLFADLVQMGAACRTRLREEMQIEFTIEDGRLAVLDAVKVARSARAGLRIAVALAEDGVIGKDEAVLRVEPARCRNCCTTRSTRAARATSLPAGSRPAPVRRPGGWCFRPMPRRPRPRRESPASWCGARPRPRIFAACIRPWRC